MYQTRLAVDFNLLNGQQQHQLVAIFQTHPSLVVSYAAVLRKAFHHRLSIFRVGPNLQLQGGMAHRLLARVTSRGDKAIVNCQKYSTIKCRDRSEDRVGIEGGRESTLRR